MYMYIWYDTWWWLPKGCDTIHLLNVHQRAWPGYRIAKGWRFQGSWLSQIWPQKSAEFFMMKNRIEYTSNMSKPYHVRWTHQATWHAIGVLWLGFEGPEVLVFPYLSWIVCSDQFWYKIFVVNCLFVVTIQQNVVNWSCTKFASKLGAGFSQVSRHWSHQPSDAKWYPSCSGSSSILCIPEAKNCGSDVWLFLGVWYWIIISNSGRWSAVQFMEMQFGVFLSISTGGGFMPIVLANSDQPSQGFLQLLNLASG